MSGDVNAAAETIRQAADNGGANQRGWAAFTLAKTDAELAEYIAVKRADALALVAEVERLQEALREIAADQNYVSASERGRTAGAIARAALAAEETPDA